MRWFCLLAVIVLASADTKFRLYRRGNEEGTNLWANSVAAIQRAKYVIKDTVIIIHGWKGPGPWMPGMTKAILKKEDLMVFRADWSYKAVAQYSSALRGTEDAANDIAKFIDHLASLGLSRDRIHLIGHSLGGIVAAKTGSKRAGIGRITGLDTAEAGINFSNNYQTLDRSDAAFVVEIHAAVSKRTHKGHADFYVNGCPFSKDRMCNHSQVPNYFTATINNNCRNNWQAISCSSYDAWKSGNCGRNAVTKFGWNGGLPSNVTFVAGSSTQYYITIGTTYPYC